MVSRQKDVVRTLALVQTFAISIPRRFSRAESRVENFDELINVASRFSRTPDDLDAGLSELAAFLAHAALKAGEGQGEAWED